MNHTAYHLLASRSDEPVTNDTGKFLKLCADMETEESLSPLQTEHRSAAPCPRVGDPNSGTPRCDIPLSNLLVVDERLPLVPLFRALAAAGYVVRNDLAGRLVITSNNT